MLTVLERDGVITSISDEVNLFLEGTDSYPNLEEEWKKKKQ